MESLVNALVEQLDVGIVVLDDELRIDYWNTFVSRSSGRNLSAVRGQPFITIFPEAEGNNSYFETLIANARGRGASLSEYGEHGCIVQIHHDSAARHGRFSITQALAFDLNGRRFFGLILRHVASGEVHLNGAGDHRELVQELERANRQLLQSEKLAAIGQLAAGVAHEINNPIGYVLSNLTTLAGYVRDMLKIIDATETVDDLDKIRQLKQSLDYDYLRSDVTSLLDESQDGIDRVKKIITALKDFSHIEEDEFCFCDVHRGLETTLNLVNNELKYKAEIVKEYGDVPEVECIPSQINQVVMNLLVNAAHAIEQFGQITVRSGVDGDWAWFEVEDTGKGIPANLLNRIYEPFFTTKPVGEGTGLGLSLSYNIIQKHHGRIEVFSLVGRGSRFRIWLPTKQPESSPTSEVSELP